MRPVESFYVWDDKLNADHRHELVRAYGPYCAYCESPLGSDVPRSYRVSVSRERADIIVGKDVIEFTKGVPGKEASGWDNAALACAACVRAKEDRLDSRAAFTWLQARDPNMYTDLKNKVSRRKLLGGNDQSLIRAAIGSWLWPESHYTAEGFLVIGGDHIWSLLDIEKSVSSQRDLHNRTRPLVRLTDAELQSNDFAKTFDGVWLVPNDTYIQQLTAANAPWLINDPAKTEAEQRQGLTDRVLSTILGWNLNYMNPARPDIVDRRVETRTQAHAVANDLGSRLSEHVTNAVREAEARGEAPGTIWPEGAEINSAVEMIHECLRATGCWTVWARLFYNVFSHPAAESPWPKVDVQARQLMFYRLFINYETDLRFEFADPTAGIPFDVDTLPEAEGDGDPLAFAGNVEMPDTDELRAADDEDNTDDDEHIIAQTVLPGTDPDRVGSIEAPS